MPTSEQPTTEQVKFAQSLAAPDKETRDKTVATLRSYLGSLKEMLSELEMLKLWKGLYYCMWLSDKAPVQNELAESLADLITAFKLQPLAFLYVRVFFRTIVREWHLMDQHRINKFYVLIRVMLRKVFKYCHDLKWPSDVTEALLKTVREEILEKRPNGPRFHMSDVYLEELALVTQGKLTTEKMLLVLQPFLYSLGHTDDLIFQERLAKAVFLQYVNEYAPESKALKKMRREAEGEDDEDDNYNDNNGDGSGNGKSASKSPSIVFSKVKTQQIQAAIFAVASDEETLPKNMKRCYAVHKEYATATKISVVPDSDSHSSSVPPPPLLPPHLLARSRKIVNLTRRQR